MSSRVENILQAIIDSTPYGEPPQSRVEELLIELKEIIEAGGGGGGTTNYNLLQNKPSVNGVTLQGNKTTAELGITEYDDTQVYEAINSLGRSIGSMGQTVEGKVDKVTGKGLSTNDYTDEEKTKLAGLENYNDSTIIASLNTKVDKISGKGLSTEDYTTAEKTKLAGLSNYDDTALTSRVSALETTVGDINTILEEVL